MAKLKPIIVVLLLVGLAGAGAFYGLIRLYENRVPEEAEAELVRAERLLLDSMRVERFVLIQKLWAERRDEALTTTLSRLPATADLAEQARRGTLEQVSQQLHQRLSAVQHRLGLTRLSVLSSDGRLVAQAPENAFGENLKGLPVVRDCLNGVARDGLYELEGALSVVAAVPMQDNRPKILGCLMTTRPLSRADLTEMAKASDTGVALFLRKGAVLSTLDPQVTKELASLVDGKNPIRFGEPSRPVPMLLDLRGKSHLARSIPIPGGTDPVHLTAVVDLSARFESLGKAQMFVLYSTGGLFVFGVLLSLLLIGNKIDKQFVRLRDSVHLMAEGNGYTFDPESFSGIYQELAHALKRVVDASQAATSYRRTESVSQILGPRPEAGQATPQADLGSLDFESLLDRAASSGSDSTAQPTGASALPTAELAVPAQPFESTSFDPVSSPPATPSQPPLAVAPPETPSLPPTDASQTPRAAQRGPKVDMPGDLASFFDDGVQGVTRETDAPATGWDEAAAGPSAPPSAPPAMPFDAQPIASTPPPPSLPVDLSSSPPPMPLVDLSSTDEDERAGAGGDYKTDATVIAQVPDELLKAASSDTGEPATPPTPSAVLPPPTTLPKPPVVAATSSKPLASGEEIHFREVFERFIQTKKQCGEPVAGLTVDKFVEKLHKNSTDLKTRYRCQTVKFQVYVKNGKAALKATPVR